MESQNNSSIYRAEGVTTSERYLTQLANRSFLSLWSYSNVYRDQGRKASKGDGKEFCDLLVVFNEHIIIFSDKNCTFTNSGNLDVDWRRWYKKTIENSANQIWGAENWINSYPKLIFLDSTCTVPFPIPLPISAKAKIHRIVVAHGASERCKAELGGSGSLMLFPAITGFDHIKAISDGGRPFAVGQVDPTKGYVHIFDDTSLAIILGKLDTITDFVSYLQKKESFVLSGQLLGSAGEEELLAHYAYQSKC